LRHLLFRQHTRQALDGREKSYNVPLQPGLQFRVGWLSKGDIKRMKIVEIHEVAPACHNNFKLVEIAEVAPTCHSNFKLVETAEVAPTCH
jgi:hypothetical protein